MNVRLLVMQGKPAGKALFFGPGDYYLGRGPECHVRFNSDWVSRQHCLLRVCAEYATVRDLGSRNGTLVNGQLLGHEQVLAEGDQVQIGPVVFEIHLDRPPGEPSTLTPAPPEIFRSGDPDSSHGEPPLDSTVLPPLLQREDEERPG